MPLNVILNSLFNVLYLILLARIIMSWFPVRPGGVAQDIIEVLYAITEPILAPIRKLVPPVAVGMGRLDLAPLILILLINIIRRNLL